MVLYYGTLYCTTYDTWYCIMKHGIEKKHATVLYNMVLYYDVWYYTIKHGIVL